MSYYAHWHDSLRKVFRVVLPEVCFESMLDKKKGMIVIIKPTKKSTYRNLVDILDEMAICDVPTYAIVNDITPEEQKLVDEMNK